MSPTQLHITQICLLEKMPQMGQLRRFEAEKSSYQLRNNANFSIIFLARIRQIHPPQQIPKHLSSILKKLRIIPTTPRIRILKPNPQPLGDFPHLGKGFDDHFVTESATHLSLAVSCLQRSCQVFVLQGRDARYLAAKGFGLLAQKRTNRKVACLKVFPHRPINLKVIGFRHLARGRHPNFANDLDRVPL